VSVFVCVCVQWRERLLNKLGPWDSRPHTHTGSDPLTRRWAALIGQTQGSLYVQGACLRKSDDWTQPHQRQLHAQENGWECVWKDLLVVVSVAWPHTLTINMGSSCREVSVCACACKLHAVYHVCLCERVRKGNCLCCVDQSPSVAFYINIYNVFVCGR
jgi:hypothetical protein